jgi:hypothetical protein
MIDKFFVETFSNAIAGTSASQMGSSSSWQGELTAGGNGSSKSKVQVFEGKVEVLRSSMLGTIPVLLLARMVMFWFDC